MITTMEKVAMEVSSDLINLYAPLLHSRFETHLPNIPLTVYHAIYYHEHIIGLGKTNTHDTSVLAVHCLCKSCPNLHDLEEGEYNPMHIAMTSSNVRSIFNPARIACKHNDSNLAYAALTESGSSAGIFWNPIIMQLHSVTYTHTPPNSMVAAPLFNNCTGDRIDNLCATNLTEEKLKNGIQLLLRLLPPPEETTNNNKESDSSNHAVHSEEDMEELVKHYITVLQKVCESALQDKSNCAYICEQLYNVSRDRLDGTMISYPHRLPKPPRGGSYSYMIQHMSTLTDICGSIIDGIHRVTTSRLISTKGLDESNLHHELYTTWLEQGELVSHLNRTAQVKIDIITKGEEVQKCVNQAYLRSILIQESYQKSSPHGMKELLAIAVNMMNTNGVKYLFEPSLSLFWQSFDKEDGTDLDEVFSDLVRNWGGRFDWYKKEQVNSLLSTDDTNRRTYPKQHSVEAYICLWTKYLLEQIIIVLKSIIENENHKVFLEKPLDLKALLDKLILISQEKIGDKPVEQLFSVTKNRGGRGTTSSSSGVSRTHIFPLVDKLNFKRPKGSLDAYAAKLTSADNSHTELVGFEDNMVEKKRSESKAEEDNGLSVVETAFLYMLMFTRISTGSQHNIVKKAIRANSFVKFQQEGIGNDENLVAWVKALVKLVAQFVNHGMKAFWTSFDDTQLHEDTVRQLSPPFKTDQVNSQQVILPLGKLKENTLVALLLLEAIRKATDFMSTIGPDPCIDTGRFKELLKPYIDPTSEQLAQCAIRFISSLKKSTTGSRLHVLRNCITAESLVEKTECMEKLKGLIKNYIPEDLEDPKFPHLPVIIDVVCYSLQEDSSKTKEDWMAAIEYFSSNLELDNYFQDHGLIAQELFGKYINMMMGLKSLWSKHGNIWGPMNRYPLPMD